MRGEEGSSHRRNSRNVDRRPECAAKSPVLCALGRIPSKIKDNKYTSRSRVQTIVRTSYHRLCEKKYPRVKRNKM